MHLRSIATAIGLAAIVACAGPPGPAGEQGPAGTDGTDGAQGPQGQQGIPGPLNSPPRITSISPTWGSASTEVTIRGESFAANPADNRVTFDGTTATVVGATATQLVVRAGSSPASSRYVAVAIEVAKQVSNPVAFLLVPPGTAGVEEMALPNSPSGVVGVGADLYVAASAFTSTGAGLYKVDATGKTSRVVRPLSFDVYPQNGAPVRVYDAPVAITTDGTDVWFTTVIGAVRRYRPASGEVSEIVGPRGPGGNTFPSLTGVARSAAGYLYVANRNLRDNNGNRDGGLWRISPAGQITDLLDPALDGAFGVVASGTDVFVTRPNYGAVARIANADGAYALTGGHVTGLSGLQVHGVAVIGGQVVAAGEDGRLWAASRTTGGAASAYLEPTGYLYDARGLWASPGGDLYLAQPAGGCVRKIASGSQAAQIVAAGTRIAFATLRAGGKWYFAGVGSGIFGSGLPQASWADGAVVEVSDDGASRVVARGGLFAGLASLSGTQLALSDCLAQKIVALDPVTGNQTTLLSASDGLLCPAGLNVNPAGDLLYVNAVIGGTGTAAIGKRTSAGANTPNFVTGLLPGHLQMAMGGGKLLVSGIGSEGAPVPIYVADATSGGAATELVSSAATGSAFAVGISPTGKAYLGRIGGEVLSLDIATGRVAPFGVAIVRAPSGGGGSGFFSMSFKPDGSIVLHDFLQQEFVVVAP